LNRANGDCIMTPLALLLSILNGDLIRSGTGNRQVSRIAGGY
jgi:hypothetical protein